MMVRMFAMALLLILLATVVQAAPLSLASGGKTAYTIIVDPDATVTEQYAATELASFLKQVTGVDFPIRQAVMAPATPILCVGPGRVQARMAPKLQLDNLKPDGIVIESVGDSLILAGDRPRGTLYAVYTFLEDAVGCRWWSSKVSTIPSRPTLAVPEQHVRYIPPLEYRETFWFDAFDRDFAARIKSNGSSERLEEQQGGKISYGGMFVHTFDRLMPPSEFAKDHPEYYSERDGKRIVAEQPYCQLCVTNPEVKRIVTERVLAYLAKNPTTNIVSVSQNDVDKHCLCAECKKLEDAEGSPMGPLLHLVNYVAAEVAKQYPNVAIDTLAYQYTRKPPLHVKPLPNVIIRLCSIECDFATPLTSDSNKTFADDIKGWNKICDRLYIWDYTTDFAHYILPFPNQRVLGDNVRFFVNNGVKGLFEQGAYQSYGAEMAECRAWILAKLLWNPKLDDRKLMDEFLTGYYGPAAPYIREYLGMLHDSVEKTKTNLVIWVPPTSAYITFDLMAKAEKLFNQAEAAAQGDAALLNRVQVARLPIRYVWATRWQEFQQAARKQGIAWPGPADDIENARTFMAVCEANDIKKLSEGRGVESFAKRTISLGRISSPPPPGCEKLATEDFADLQDPSFSLYREGEASMLEHDELASDKVAAKMPAFHNEWAVQQQLGIAGIDPEATYSVYVSVRVEKAGENGGAFSSGLYDVKNKKFVSDVKPTCKEITDNGYVTYKIATSKLHDQMYVWAAPAKNPENVKAVWVDRFWLVKEKQ
ncbi:MAG: DUF4838 domain-containing protein [Bacteroidota bacterium]